MRKEPMLNSISRVTAYAIASPSRGWRDLLTWYMRRVDIVIVHGHMKTQ